MSLDELCPHDGDPHSCPPCQRARRGPEPTESERWTPAFPAAYDGACDECNLPIYVGQMIRLRIVGVVRRPVHAGCSS